MSLFGANGEMLEVFVTCPIGAGAAGRRPKCCGRRGCRMQLCRTLRPRRCCKTMCAAAGRYKSSNFSKRRYTPALRAALRAISVTSPAWRYSCTRPRTTYCQLAVESAQFWNPEAYTRSKLQDPVPEKSTVMKNPNSGGPNSSWKAGFSITWRQIDGDP